MQLFIAKIGYRGDLHLADVARIDRLNVQSKNFYNGDIEKV